MDTGLAGKHILITGASGGIGLVTARLFLSEGAKVTGTFNRSAEPLQGLVSDYSDSLKIIKVDQTSEDDVRNLFTKANQSFGRVDVLVANAAISVPEGQSIQDMTLDRWDNTLRVNLTGSFLCAKHFFSNLEEYSGESASLILVGSTAGLFGEAWYVDYSTSKAAMHGMMMSLKNEIVHLAPLGRVNLVNPGWTLTPMAEKALTDKDMVKRILQTIPMRKTAVSEDIAGAILYLASDNLAGHVSGQTITVAGGMEGRVLFTPDEIDPT
ncbi:MAG: SDR family NAD(P)-dependent oxidoreductase [Candidatus Thorarchaeota archaeon]|jgi:NAD(P)-dependent dehydrogenase (short-subunit alcohol dehydrogenase family)